MIECQCGCGESTPTASFKPGHDQRLRITLGRRVGRLEKLREFVATAEVYHEENMDLKDLRETVKGVFKKLDCALDSCASNCKQNDFNNFEMALIASGESSLVTGHDFSHTAR
jgi:division protein CdvB (Snf7/Vps24/ESCRT-III family)